MVFRYAGRNISCHNSRTSRHFYNVIGWMYDSVYTKHIMNYKKASQYVADRYVQPGSKVLDLGCGTGVFLGQIADKASAVVGLDLSLGMLKKAKAKYHRCSHISYINADCRYLPIQHDFDTIFTGFMLVILPRKDRHQIIQNLYTYLKTGGEIVFLTSRDEFSRQWLTVDEWIYYCESSGFHDVVIEDIYDYYRVVRARK